MKYLQKTVFIGILILSAIYLLFTLGLATNVALGSTRVKELYDQTQVLNRLVFKFGLWAVILTAASFIIGNHKNENFFIPNFVTAGLSSIFLMVISVITVIRVLPIKALFLETFDVTSDNIKILIALNYAEVNTFIYDLGIFTSIAMFIFGGLSAFITIKKYSNKVKSAKIKKLSMEVSQ